MCSQGAWREAQTSWTPCLLPQRMKLHDGPYKSLYNTSEDTHVFNNLTVQVTNISWWQGNGLCNAAKWDVNSSHSRGKIQCCKTQTPFQKVWTLSLNEVTRFNDEKGAPLIWIVLDFATQPHILTQNQLFNHPDSAIPAVWGGSFSSSCGLVRLLKTVGR